MYLLELHHGLLSSPFELEAPPHSGWRLITPCDCDLPNLDATGKRIAYSFAEVAANCPLLREAEVLKQPELMEFVRLLQIMFKTALSGHNWPEVMNKQVHKVGQVNINRDSGKRESHVIMQFGKKTTLIRVVVFISAHGRKCAFVSHMFEKPANSKKTPAKEQARSQRNLQAYFDAIDSNDIQLVNVQGEKNGFLRLD